MNSTAFYFSLTAILVHTNTQPQNAMQTARNFEIGPMKIRLNWLVFACVLITAFSWNVCAEVYESKDAQGNPVFTDIPTAGAEQVDLPTENIADAVKVPPEPEATGVPGNPTPASDNAGHSDVVVVPDSRNEEMERDYAADKPHEVLDAEERYEVGDDPTAEEMERREEARKGEYIDEDGNTVLVKHRGHAGGGR